MGLDPSVTISAPPQHISTATTANYSISNISTATADPGLSSNISDTWTETAARVIPGSVVAVPDSTIVEIETRLWSHDRTIQEKTMEIDRQLKFLDRRISELHGMISRLFDKVKEYDDFVDYAGPMLETLTGEGLIGYLGASPDEDHKEEHNE